MRVVSRAFKLQLQLHVRAGSRPSRRLRCEEQRHLSECAADSTNV